MEKFKSYLISSKLTDEKKAGFYVSWVTRFYRFCNKTPEAVITMEDIERYLKLLSKSREEWQVKQAAEAIHLYQFFKDRNNIAQGKENLEISAQWKSVAEEMKKILRLMHRSYRTEQAYIGWVRSIVFQKDILPILLKAKM